MPTVRREIVLPVTRARAWELITEPAELEGWLADRVEFEPEEGAPVRATWVDGDERAGVVEKVEREQHVRFAWAGREDASEVEWTLADAADGTRLVVVERQLTSATVAPAWGPRLDALAHAGALCRA